MEKEIEAFGATARGLSKNPLGIIALFIVLVYGFAAIVTTFGSSFSATERIPLIYFLVFFPVIVIGVFGWLVSCHSSKLYGPSDYKNETNFVRMQVVAATALAAAAARCTEADIEGVDFDKITDAITEFGIPNSQNPVCKKQILWVDDRPENNVYERKAFEAVGLSFYLALSTSDALNIMKNNKFVAIISDMGRREGDQEGYVLLEAIRKQGDRTPFFIYAGSNLIEHKREAVERGAQGSTNNSQELFTLVTKAIINN